MKNLKLLLCYKNYEPENIKEKLTYTNHKLHLINDLSASCLDLLSTREIGKLAKNLLASKKPVKNVLVELSFF